MRDTESFSRLLGRLLLAATACVAIAEIPGPTGAETRTEPPLVAPGAAPSGTRLSGTWMILSTTRSPRDGHGAEGTTYRFEDGGKATVAGAKQCAYRFEGAELIVDCEGAILKGRVDFPDSETMVWTVADGETIRLKKR